MLILCSVKYAFPLDACEIFLLLSSFLFLFRWHGLVYHDRKRREYVQTKWWALWTSSLHRHSLLFVWTHICALLYPYEHALKMTVSIINVKCRFFSFNVKSLWTYLRGHNLYKREIPMYLQWTCCISMYVCVWAVGKGDVIWYFCHVQILST